MEERVGRVFVVDDVARQLQAVYDRLSDAGYAMLAGIPNLGLGFMLDAFEPDVIVTRLDGTPPEETIPFLRRGLEIPVIVIATTDTPSLTRVAATRAGSDSVFTEPVDTAELVARVDMLMEHRRSRRLLSVGDLTIDRRGHVIRRNGVELQLTATEYHLLLALATNVGQVLSKRQLLESVWGYEEYDVNVVEVHISALRRKLEAVGPRLIQTVRGFGYVLRREDPAPHSTAATTVVNTNSTFDSNDAVAADTWPSPRPTTPDRWPGRPLPPPPAASHSAATPAPIASAVHPVSPTRLRW